jgi:PAS domain S-box-containing protein
MKTTPLQQADGGAVVTHTDITVRKRAELLVRENEERFRRLADVLPVAVWMSGVDGAREYVNRTFIDITGRSMERQLGIGWLDAVHPDDRERCMGTYLRAFAKRVPFSMEYRIRRYDGEYRWLLDKASRATTSTLRSPAIWVARSISRISGSGADAPPAERKTDRRSGRGAPPHRARSARQHRPADGAGVDSAARSPAARRCGRCLGHPGSSVGRQRGRRP